MKLSAVATFALIVVGAEAWAGSDRFRPMLVTDSVLPPFAIITLETRA